MVEIYSAGYTPDLSPSTNLEDAQNCANQMRKPPLISLAMLGRAVGNEIASLDVNEVSRRVYAGVPLKDNKKQGEHQEQPYTHLYWVDERMNRSCLMVLAKGLQIRGSDDYWRWLEEEEPCYPDNIKLPIAELAGGRHFLEIKGKCKTIMLSPRTMYEVRIVVKTNDVPGFPVNLSLELPDGSRQRSTGMLSKLDDNNWTRTMISQFEMTGMLSKLEENKWTRMMIGQFEMTPKTVGEIRFSLKKIDADLNSSLYVMGVVFRPITGKKPPK